MREIHYRLTPEHIASYQRAIRSRAGGASQGGTLAEIGKFVIFAGGGLALLFAGDWVKQAATGSGFDFASLLTGMIAGVAILVASFWLNFARLRRRLTKPDGPTLSPHVMRLAPDALQVSGRGFEASYDWKMLEEVTSAGGIVVVWLEPGAGIVLPREALGTPEERKGLIDELSARIGAARQTG